MVTSPYEWKILEWDNKPQAAKLRTSMGMHNDQEYGKSIMTSHEIIDGDKGAKMLII